MKRLVNFTILAYLYANMVHGAIPDQFYGEIYDLNGNKIAIEEHNVFRNDAGKVSEIKTFYFYPKEKNYFAFSDSYFDGNEYLPNYFFTMLSKSFTARSVLHKGQDVTIFRKSGSDSFYLKKTYPIKGDMVVGHGFYFYLFKHLQTLLDNPMKEIPVHFLIPNKLDDHVFMMSARPDPYEKNVAIVTLKLRNPLYRLIYKTVVVKVDIEKEHFLSYSGPNSFLYDGEKVSNVYIEYFNSSNLLKFKRE